MKNETLFLRRNLAQKNQQEMISTTSYLPPPPPPEKFTAKHHYRRLSLFLTTILLLLNLACDEDNNKSENGDKATPDPKSTIIPVPENLSSDETSSRDGAYILSWDEVSGASTYKLREGETELELSSDDIQNRTHSVSGKETGSYDYQVQACDASGVCSEWSGALTVNVFTSDPPTLTLSDETRGTGGAYRSRDGLYTLSWNSLGEDVTYELREGEDEDGEITLSSATATTHSVTTAKMNGSYNYYVRACHTNGVCSDWSSDPLTVHVFTESAPTLTLTLTPTETRATDGTYSSADGIYALTWNEVTDAASYELLEEVMSESNTPLSLSEEDLQNRTHSISDKPGGSYSYRLRACHMNTACTAWSNTFSLSVSRNCAGDSAQTSGFQDGDGSSDSPFLICDYTQLKKMGEDEDALEKHYKLGKDIDASDSRSDGTKRSSTTDTECMPYDSAITDSARAGHHDNPDTCTGWKPVGNTTTAFTGSLQGLGYVIRNLYINIRTDIVRAGLFGQTGRASVIQNLGLTDAYIRIDTNNSRVGSLVGWNEGSVSNSYATGSVTGGGSDSYVGGLVGENEGSISNSYAAGSPNVSGSNSHVGGLVGENEGSISNSYATGSPNVPGSSSRVGGLVGRNTTEKGSISNSYATGSPNVPGPRSHVGGLVGWNYNEGSISNSYATGSVTGGNFSTLGGLAGWNTGSGRFSGKNYFVARNGTNGIGFSIDDCEPETCIHAGTQDQSDDERRTWLQDTLDESAPIDATPPAQAGLGWSDTNWEGFVGTDVGYPKLKYAQVSYCSASPATLTTPELCLAAGSCDDGTSPDRDTCVGTDPPGRWTPTNTWDAGDDECGGSTGVVCGARIGGQD